MILSIENISKMFGGNTVLNNVAMTIEDSDRIGLVGINGCGKSTLLKIIVGDEEPETQPNPNEARISKCSGLSVGFLRQNAGLDRSNSIIEEMRSVFAKLYEVQDRMRQLETEMSAENAHKDEKHFEELSGEYAKLSAYFESNEGYLIDVNINKVLNGMGFPRETYDQIISTLSGGEKTRLALAKLLLENPKLLILDEPTNHLDFQTVMWLEDYLSEYKGALFIVSHDRYFLDKLCTSICEIERGRLTRYKGNYSAFTVQKEANVVRQMKEYEAQQAEIAKLQDFVDRNLVRATTSNMAKSRIKMIERIEENLIEKPITYEKQAKIRFEYDIVPPIDLLTVKNIDVTVGTGSDRKTLADNLSFEVKRGDKLAIIGANGIGKSSLLKVIRKDIPHAHGTVEWTKNVKISYFDQENSQLHPQKTVIDEIHDRWRTMTELQIRSLLGCVRMTGENVFKQVGVISGGERAKLCFAIMMLERGNVLILDEPTNHLDLATKEVLEEALDAFDGTIIFVSHDRYLLNKIATGILEITENGAEYFKGDFDNYISIKQERQAAQQKAEDAAKEEKQRQAAAEKGVKAYRTKEQRARDAEKRRRIKELEAEIERMEGEMSALQEEMASPEVCADYQLMNEKCAEFERLKNLSAEYSDEWIMLCEELDL
ncbi:MAG: ATP-binding cassette domain-containing protein [Oscillospiraceae bacterium]|nr:ATP-binding cassette domain-containing protein [Oscillospiraceae bacterium]